MNKPLRKLNTPKTPCAIYGIAGFDIDPGECRSFDPYAFFGICDTCSNFSVFADEHCTSKPLNRRQVFSGVNRGRFDTFRLCTCDKYKISNWKASYVFRAALEGRCPMNFDPDTFKPIEHIDGKPLPQWKEKQAEYLKGQARKSE